MRNNSEQKQVDFWLDVRSNIENLLQSGEPADHLEILEHIYNAYINSEWADDREARQKAHVEVAIFKDILKTLQRHSMTSPAFLPSLAV
ncbi:hypothetical protein ACX0HA_09040 [Flavobacterium hauense]